jgi:hypothetical protein
VYFPVISQPGFGLVRTVVKDDNDTDRGQESVRCMVPVVSCGNGGRTYIIKRPSQGASCITSVHSTASVQIRNLGIHNEPLATGWHLVCRYLDSDGVSGYANTLLAGNTSNNPTYDNVARRAPIDAMDGAWHMVTVTSWVVTVTSWAQGTPGYRWVWA